MKIFNFCALTGAILLMVSGCSRLGSTHADSQILLVDVNDADIYNDCHIKGAINVPFDQAEAFAKAYAHKDAPTVIYCANYQCLASSQVAKIFKQQGFKDVRVYEAGIAGWYQAHLAYEGAARQGFLSAKSERVSSDKKSDLTVIETDQLQKLLKNSSNCTCTCPCCA